MRRNSSGRASTKKHVIRPDFYPLLESNKAAFDDVFAIESTIAPSRGSRGGEVKFTGILRAIQRSPAFTMKTKNMWKVSRADRRRALPKATIKKILTKIAYTRNTLPMLAKIKSEISEEFFRRHSGRRYLRA